MAIDEPAPPDEGLMDAALEAERSGRFGEARALLRRAIAADPGPSRLEARLRLGRLAIQAGERADLAEAERELMSARSIAGEAGDARSAAVAIHLLALLARARQEYPLAWKLLEESPASVVDAGRSPERAQWLHYRGLLHAHRGELDDAERSFLEARRVGRDCRYEETQAQVCDSLANLLIRRGKAALALTFARQSLELKRGLGDRYGTSISLGTAGRALVHLARYDEAADAFERNLAIARGLGTTQAAGRVLNDLAHVALLRGRVDEAVERYEAALAFEGSPAHALHAHLGLARAHLSARRPDEAEAACDRAAAVLEARPDLRGFPDVLGGLRGTIAWRRGDPEAGERALVASIAALEAGGHLLDMIPFLHDLRDLYQERRMTAKAIEVMGRALDLLSECGSERGVQDVEDWLRRVDSPNLIRLALERHLPGWLIDEMLQGRLRRPPSRVQPVAVLFSDIRDYAAMTEGMGAEAIVELLNDWFSEVARIVRRHGGYVDKFIGDAVMAVFGLPEPRESMAADAVRAALEMRAALASMNMRREFLDRRPVRIGIGIDLGEAVVGFIGSHLRQSYTAIGEAVNTAARLEAATKDDGCEILIGERVEQPIRTSGVAEVEYVGRLPLKGITRPVAAYRVLGRAEFVRNVSETVEDGASRNREVHC